MLLFEQAASSGCAAELERTKTDLPRKSRTMIFQHHRVQSMSRHGGLRLRQEPARTVAEIPQRYVRTNTSMSRFKVLSLGGVRLSLRLSSSTLCSKPPLVNSFEGNRLKAHCQVVLLSELATRFQCKATASSDLPETDQHQKISGLQTAILQRPTPSSSCRDSSVLPPEHQLLVPSAEWTEPCSFQHQALRLHPLEQTRAGLLPPHRRPS